MGQSICIFHAVLQNGYILTNSGIMRILSLLNPSDTILIANLIADNVSALFYAAGADVLS